MSASPNSKHHLLEDSIPENKEVETPSKLPSHHHLMDNNHHEFLALPHKRTRTLSEYYIFCLARLVIQSKVKN